MVKNRLKIYFLFLLAVCAYSFAVLAQQPNTLTPTEKQEGWQLLFDGETFAGLKMLTGAGWEIEDGILKAKVGGEHGQKDIITQRLFGNFELAFEFKISNKTNSGVKYVVTNDYPGQEGKYLGLEYQILDNVNFDYPERGELRTLASLYDLIPADTRVKVPLGKWNSAKIVVNGNHIEHWLNDEKVVVYDRSSERFKSLVKDSKYKNLEDFGQAPKGHILFQNEGSAVAFRSIKIKPLGTPDPGSSAAATSQYSVVNAEDGYRMWLRYEKIADKDLLDDYRKELAAVIINDSSPTMMAVKKEISKGLSGLIDSEMPFESSAQNGMLVLGTPANSPLIASLQLQEQLDQLGNEGFLIERKSIEGKSAIVIAANTELGVLYGTFHFLRMLQIHQSIDDVFYRSMPRAKLRLANHWDDVDRTVGRGYAGLSLWEWST